MKQIIEIEVPEGKKAIWKDGKVIFEDITPKLPETWEEFCKFYPIKEGESYIEDKYCNTPPLADQKRNPNNGKNILPSIEAANAHLALMQLHQLRDCYRQGWVPDWKINSDKYCIQCTNNKYSIFNYTNYRCFLAFQSQELAEKFLKNFIVLIKQAGDLI